MPSRAKPQFSFIFYVGIFTFYVGIFIFYVGIFIFYVAKKKVWTFYERISNAVTRMNTDFLLLDFVNFGHCWILSHPNRLSIDNQLIINSFRRRAFTAAASLMKKAGWRLPQFPITEIKKKKKKKLHFTDQKQKAIPPQKKAITFYGQKTNHSKLCQFLLTVKKHSNRFCLLNRHQFDQQAYPQKHRSPTLQGIIPKTANELPRVPYNDSSRRLLFTV